MPQTGSDGAIKDMARRGLACAILPHSAVAEDIQAGALVIRPICDPALMRTLFLIHPAGTDVNAATAQALRIIDGLLDELRQRDRNFTVATEEE
ncbi:LysR substrate-binding domain-containing protein [Azospirillum melinis]